MDASIIQGQSKLKIGERVISLSHGPRACTVLNDTVVALLTGWSDPDIEFFENLGADMSHKKGGADFELENPYRNVVGFDADAEPIWTIPEAPHDPPADVEPYYMSLWTADELWVRNKNQRAYRVDPDGGDLLEDVPADQLRLGGRTIDFDRGWVGQVLHHDDMVAVRLEGVDHPGPSGKNLYVFDRDGAQRWWIGDRLDDEAPSPAPAFTNIWLEEGDLWGYATDGYAYRFEFETGELLDAEWRK